MARQEKFKHKKFSLIFGPLFPHYWHCVSTSYIDQTSPSQKYLLNHKEQYSSTINKIIL